MEPMVRRRGSDDKKASHEPITRRDTPGARHHMRILGRNDAFLLGGFAIAVWVVSSRQLGMLLDRAREIDHSRGLQLVPALAILAVVFLVPSAASKLKTWQDCWSLGFNLMFLSALPGAVLAVVTPITDHPMVGRKKKRECGCRECCRDCCGEGCDAGIEGCGECCCDKCCGHCHCNCCDGCCDSCGCDCGSP